MAGPGGGGRGGGGGRSRGGFSGGSRGGGFRYTYHVGGPHMGGGWHHRGGHGGGCLSQLIVPIFLLFFIAMEFMSVAWSDFTSIGQGGAARYSEEVYQDYADAQYAEAFGSSSAYEDNLLISVLVNEDHYSYYYIAWVGDHIATDINHMLGGNDTVLGQAMESCINQSSYKYSLDSNLAQVMEILTEEVEALNLEDSFTCGENHSQGRSVLINDSALDLTESTVNNALAAFTGKTGIPAVVVVEDMTDVFNRSLPIGTIVILVVLSALMIHFIVKVIRNMRRSRHPDESYNSFDDQY